MADKERAFNVQNLPHLRSANFVSIYSNSAHVAFSFYDLSILLSQIVPGPDGDPVLEEKVAIAMSLEHAKALMEALRGTIERYEKDNGPIRSKSSSVTAGVVAAVEPKE